jgi:hypothetical protein
MVWPAWRCSRTETASTDLKLKRKIPTIRSGLNLDAKTFCPTILRSGRSNLTCPAMSNNRAKANRLLRRCASAREVRFNTGRKIINAVSVADRDSKRPEVVAILKGCEPLWPPGACNMGMTMWVQYRTWYPIKA